MAKRWVFSDLFTTRISQANGFPAKIRFGATTVMPRPDRMAGLASTSATWVDMVKVSCPISLTSPTGVAGTAIEIGRDWGISRAVFHLILTVGTQVGDIKTDAES